MSWSSWAWRPIRGACADAATLTESVAPGKRLRENPACINRHTIRATPKGWMDCMPFGIEGRRQMSNLGPIDADDRAIADFLLWTDTIQAQDRPPNDAG